ncbi:MAG: nuclear transport factor 2 family protein [Nitratireductor sp.]|nr:nuclear transport factor 2 family protein [Nitratireductor sp.]
MSATTIIQSYFDAFNRSDMAALEALLDEKVEHHVNQGPVRPGIEKFRAFNAHMTERYKEEISELVIFANEDGTRAAAEFLVTGTYLKTDEGLPEARGQRYELPAGSFFTLKNGRITRVTTYYNLQDWLKQVAG